MLPRTIFTNKLKSSHSKAAKAVDEAFKHKMQCSSAHSTEHVTPGAHIKTTVICRTNELVLWLQ